MREILAVPAARRSPAQEAVVFSYWRTTVPEFREAYESSDEAKRLVDVAKTLEGVSRNVSGWYRAPAFSRDVGRDAAAAVAASLQPPGQVVTLVLPADVSWGEGAVPARPRALPAAQPVDDEAVGRAELLDVACGQLHRNARLIPQEIERCGSAFYIS